MQITKDSRVSDILLKYGDIADVMEIFHRLHREQGLTVVMVTHDPKVAAQAQRVIYFQDGLIAEPQQQGGA